MMIIVNERVVLLGTFRCGLLCRLGSDKRRCRSNVRDPACQISVEHGCTWTVVFGHYYTTIGKFGPWKKEFLRSRNFSGCIRILLLWKSEISDFVLRQFQHSVPDTYSSCYISSFGSQISWSLPEEPVGSQEWCRPIRPLIRQVEVALNFARNLHNRYGRLPSPDTPWFQRAWFIMIHNDSQQNRTIYSLYRSIQYTRCWFPMVSWGFCISLATIATGDCYEPQCRRQPWCTSAISEPLGCKLTAWIQTRNQKIGTGWV